MTIQMYLDDVLCEGYISKFNWFKALFSIALYPTNWVKWEYFKVTDIKGNPKYETWDYIYVPIEDIKWENLRFFRLKFF